MGWCDLISSIILSFFLVHAFNSSYFKEFRGPLETTVPLFVCVNEKCGFGGSELRSELQEDCAGNRAHVLLGNTQLLLLFFCATNDRISLSLVQNGQTHTSDRGHCVTHCRLSNTVNVYFICLFLLNLFCENFADILSRLHSK